MVKKIKNKGKRINILYISILEHNVSNCINQFFICKIILYFALEIIQKRHKDELEMDGYVEVVSLNVGNCEEDRDLALKV